MQRYDAVVIGAGVGGMTAAARLLGAFTKQATKIGANFAARARLIDAPGLMTFGRTERLCNMGELTATCPELAPLGWRQYVAYAVPKPALGNFDEKAEIEASRADLRALFPGFAEAKMLSVRVMRGEWPAPASISRRTRRSPISGTSTMR